MNKDFLKDAFGKEKDAKTHARVMLAIYAVFIIIVIFMIRTGNSNTKNKNTNASNNKENISEVKNDINNQSDDITTVEKKNTTKFDINYSYSYKVEYDDQVETYLGRKVDDKEMFSYIKGDSTLDYAIYNGNYLLKKDGVYHITDAIDTYFKYCDVEKIVNLIEKLNFETEGNVLHYTVNNSAISTQFSDSINNWNKDTNRIDMTVENDTLKTIKLDFTNYISAKLNSNHKLIITMDFANVGTTEDFELKIN